MAGDAGGNTAGEVQVVITADQSPYDAATSQVRQKAEKLVKDLSTTGSTNVFSGVVKSAEEAGKEIVSTSTALELFREAAIAVSGPLGALVGAAGFAGLVIAGAEVVKVFAELETQLLTIDAALKATSDASGQTTSSINEMASSISKVSLATEDDLRGAAIAITKFRTIAGDQFEQVLKLSTDLAAVGFGSVQGAATALGRALENPTTGLARLTRAGITFTEGQKLLIKQLEGTGETAKAQEVVLKGLEDRVGGAAQGQASGLSGAFHNLQQATNNYFESLGGRIANALGLQSGIQSIISFVQKLNQAMNLPDSAPLGERLEQVRHQAADADKSIEDLTNKLTELQAQQASIDRGKGGGNEAYRLMQQQINDANKALKDFVATSVDLHVKLAALEQQDAFEKTAASAKSAAAQTEIANEKFQGVISTLQQQIKLLGMTAEAQKNYEDAQKAGVVGNAKEEASIVALNAKIDELNFKRSQSTSLYSRDALKSLQTSLLNQTQLEVQNYIQRQLQAEQFLKKGYITQQQYAELSQKLYAENAYKLQDIERQKNDIIFNSQVAAANEAANLLTQVGNNSKAAAIAGILLSKAIAIATIIHNTSAAAVAAVAPPPIGLGPVAGAPLAASITAWGYTQAALVAATGLAQAVSAAGSSIPSASSGSSASSGGGGVSSPTTGTPLSGGGPSLTQTSLRIDGIDPAKLYSGKQIRDLIKQINAATSNGTPLISTRNLRQ